MGKVLVPESFEDVKQLQDGRVLSLSNGDLLHDRNVILNFDSEYANHMEGKSELLFVWFVPCNGISFVVLILTA